MTNEGISFSELHRIAGYIECGEGEAVTFSQDDATKTWCVKVGKNTFHSESLARAFLGALNHANDYYKQAYGLDAPGQTENE